MAVSISIAIAQNNQSVVNNTSNVTVKVTAKWTYGSFNRNDPSGSCTIDGTKYTFTSDFNASQTTSGSQVIFTKTLNIKHGDDGTKKLSCSASYATGVSSGTVSASASKTLTTIPRKSTLSASNGTLGNAQTLTVTRKSTSFTHTITYKCGSASGTIATKSSDTSISWTPPLSLAQQNTTGTSVSITLTIETFSGSTSVGSNTLTISGSIPASVVPTVSIAVSDASGYADTFGGYIQGRSKIKIVVTASGSQGSTIKSYSTTADGKAYTDATVTTGVISGSGTLTIKTTVKDSRGRTATASKNITVFAYAVPKITAISAKRCNEDGSANSAGSYIAVTFSTVSSSVDGKNNIAYAIKYKKASETAYTTKTVSAYAGKHSVSNAVYIFPAETSSSYDITLTVTDSFKSASKPVVGSSVEKVWSMLKKAGKIVGWAIGKVAELEGVLDIAIPVKLREGIMQNVLWTGVYYMNASQTVTLSEAISKQPTGIVLIFSRYDVSAGEAMNEHFSYHFVPKTMVELHPGKGSVFQLGTSNETYAGSKYLYISDTQITGHDNNTEIGTGATGVNYNNNRFVLRYVIGV